MTSELGKILPSRRLFAAASPPRKRDGSRWIDYRSLSYLAKDARSYAAEYHNGGWESLKKRGWSIVRVDIIPSAPPALKALREATP